MSNTQEKILKSIKLRAFEIKNNDIDKKTIDACDKLKERLKGSKSCEDREMILNEDDPFKERNFISNYSDKYPEYLFFTIMRISDNTDAGIPKELLEKEQFSFSELSSTIGNDTEALKALYKNHFYCAMNNKYLITNLHSNRTIKPIQTYLNYYISDTIIELNPVIKKPDSIKLNEIDIVEYKDPITAINNISTTNLESENESKIKHLYIGLKDFISNLQSESVKLNDTELEQLVSIELKLKFKQPKGMSDYDYKQKLSANIKPIADLDSVVYKTKTGDKFIKGKDIIETKIVDVEDIGLGRISEPDLSIEMGKYLKELSEKNV